jgi:hypothetical protein
LPFKVRFVKYRNEIYVVKGFAYDTRFDPPECYVVVPLKYNVFRSFLNVNYEYLPFYAADEIVDQKTIQVLMNLYGDWL